MPDLAKKHPEFSPEQVALIKSILDDARHRLNHEVPQRQDGTEIEWKLTKVDNVPVSKSSQFSSAPTKPQK